VLKSSGFKEGQMFEDFPRWIPTMAVATYGMLSRWENRCRVVAPGRINSRASESYLRACW
jgi:hypothetical protein